MLRAATHAASAALSLSRRARTAHACPVAPPQSSWRCVATPAPAAPRCSLHASFAAAAHSSQRSQPSCSNARRLLTLGGAALVTFAAVSYLVPSGPAPALAEEKHSGASKATKQTNSAAAASSAPAAAAPAASPASSDEVEPSPSHADHAQCRACRDGGEEAISAFFKKSSDAAAAAAAAAAATADAVASPASSGASPAAAAAAPCHPCFAYSHSLCPLNRAEVGRASWGYLHTLAAYYPASPTVRQQAEMAQLLALYMKYYPCGYCADRALEQIEREPVTKAVGSQRNLSAWMCRMHNEVNERLGKPIFDCDYVDQRWRDGPPTGECD